MEALGVSMQGSYNKVYLHNFATHSYFYESQHTIFISKTEASKTIWRNWNNVTAC